MYRFRSQLSCFPGAVRLPARLGVDDLLATLVFGDSREVAAPSGLPSVSLRGGHRVMLSRIRVTPRGGVTIARTLQRFSRFQLIDEIYLAADAPAEERSQAHAVALCGRGASMVSALATEHIAEGSSRDLRLRCKVRFTRSQERQCKQTQNEAITSHDLSFAARPA